jgi:hypothetical protein
MKNIFKFLSLFFLLPIVLYGSEFSNWSEEAPIDNGNIIIESETRYKWYKEIKTDIKDKYDLYDENRKDIIDLNDFIYTETKTVYEKPETKPYRNISSETFTYTYDPETTSQILFDHFSTSSEVGISEIIVYDKVNLKIIPYNTSITFANADYSQKLYDRKYSEKSILANNKTTILLYLDKKYKVEDILVSLFINDDRKNIDTFDISYLKDSKYRTRTKTFTIETSPLICYGPLKYCRMTIDNTSDDWLVQSVFYETRYNYNDTLFMYYKTEKEYLDGYHIEAENNYIKDETDYKVYYRYKNKEIEDNKKEENIINNLPSKDIPLIKKEYSAINNNKEKTIKDEISNIEPTLALGEEKIKLLDVKKSSTNKNYKEIFGIIGLLLILFIIIGRIISKKNKIRRTL